MKILFCSDGSIQAENAVRFGSLIAGACQAEATVLGIAESAEDQSVLLESLARAQQLLRDKAVSVEITSKGGEPIPEILKRTLEIAFDLVIIGAVRKGTRGAYWMSAKAYKIIKAIAPPVLVVIGSRTKLHKILVCSGGRHYIDKALELTGRVARLCGAKVTLVHVMAEPPQIYADLIAREENVDLLLNSSSLLGQNLKHVKQTLDAIGVPTEIRLRHGEVMPELLEEIRSADYDLIVVGSAPARGQLQTYIMGDITRELVNKAQCPVLVVRTSEASPFPASFTRFLLDIKDAFKGRSSGE